MIFNEHQIYSLAFYTCRCVECKALNGVNEGMICVIRAGRNPAAAIAATLVEVNAFAEGASNLVCSHVLRNVDALFDFVDGFIFFISDA